MNLRKIKSYEKKAIKEAQAAVDDIFKKYSALMVSELSGQIPKGHLLNSWNGMCTIEDQKGEQIKYGNAWSRTHIPNEQMDYIASLQYGTDASDLQGSFDIPTTIKGSKPLPL